LVKDIEKYVDHYAEYFKVHKRNVSHRALQYIKGLLQASQRNMEKMAEAVPQTDEQALQQFLSDSPWDYQTVMDHVASDANALLGGSDSALLLDESGIGKKGKHSVGVARQWCGRFGKVDNCQVGVYAALAKESDSCLIDAQLFLPEEWTEDPGRCDKARVPREKQKSRTKIDIALELVHHARDNAIHYGWIGADSLYGRDKQFHQALHALGETYVLDVPQDFTVYLQDPTPSIPAAPKTGRTPTRYKTQEPFIEVRQWVHEQGDSAWRQYTFRQGVQGPMSVEAQYERVWVWDGHSAQAHCCHLLVKREADGGVKYSISNAPAQTSMRRLLYMQGQRHFIERSFQDSKSHLGLDHYQARNWNSWHHHMALIMMAMVFLLQQRLVRKNNHPLLTVSDMVFIFATVLPSRKNNLEQAIEIIEERHRKRQRDIELRSKRPPKRRSAAVKQRI
jgi:SRSO17 transposase